MNTTTKQKAIETTVMQLSSTDGRLMIQSGINVLSLDLSGLAPEILRDAALHGLKQKICDAAAIGRNPDTGRSATEADKYEAMRRVWERLTSDTPSWNAVRSGGGDGGTGGLLLEALFRLYEGRKPRAALREYLAGKSKAEQAALRKASRVAEIILEIQAETASDDGEDLLAELDDLE